MTDTSAPPARAEIVVDLAALRGNVERLRELIGVPVMVVVKADGYGHGMVEAARAARAGGAAWLGVATLDEAVALRAAGDTGRLFAWLAVPGEDHGPAIRADVDVAAYTLEQLREIEEAAGDGIARVHLKIDTGLSRGGATAEQWPGLCRAAAASDRVRVVGIWSHFACSDEPEHPANDAQEQAFRDAVDVARAAGLDPEVCHLASSAGALHRPSSRFDLVRCGIASYGLAPAPDVATSADLGLTPVMTVRGPLVLAKDIAAGAGVSYGHTWTAPEAMRVGLVPMGYGDGIPRQASSTAQVWLGGCREPVLGRICMDQFVVAAPDGAAGDEVVLFGDGSHGAPTAQDWADWCGTISYEIVTRMGGRQQRVYVGGED